MSRPLNPWKLSGYKPGQNVICRVTSSEPGGYAVIIPKDNLPGFLPTQAILRTGEEILAQFVCVHNNRILLSARFSNTTVSMKAGTQSPDWYAQLEDMDGSGATIEEYEPPAVAPNNSQYNYGQPQNPFEQPPPLPSQTSPTINLPAGSNFSQSNNQGQSNYGQAPGNYGQTAGGWSQPASIQPATGQGAWGPPPSNGESGTAPGGVSAQPGMAQPAIRGGAPSQHMSTHVQKPFMVPQTDEEKAFSVWVESQPRKFHLKRATDLILPPIDSQSDQTFKVSEYDLEWLITHLEGGMTTGCVKASSEERLSRSAMLLYRGRAVGCIYGCKSMPETQPTEQSLQRMLLDLEQPTTEVRMYDLPEGVTLAMSALFLGYPVQRNDDYDAMSYMDYICNWFESKAQTACLAITLPSSQATCLGFIHKGQWCGAFYVEDQKYTKEIEFVHELLRKDKDAGVEASILPPEMTSSAVKFGFSLSMARQRNR